LPWVARYVASPYRMFSALVARYGDPVFLRLPESPGTVMTGHRDGVRAIIGADNQTLVPWRVPATVECLTDDSIFLQAGDAHRAVRKALAPCFQPVRHAHDCATMARVVDAELDAWPSGPVRMQALAQRLTLQVILAALFGAMASARRDAIAVAARRATDDTSPAFVFARALRRWGGRLGRFGAFERVRDSLEEIRVLVQEEVVQRRAADAAGAAGAAGADAERGRAPDMLALVMAARRPDGTALSDREIQVHVADLIVAGYETTTVALAWTIDELCRHPAAMARLVAELDAHGAPRDPAGLARLPYLEAVCCEGLRLHPPLAFLSRRVARPLDVHGYTVPAGVGVSMALPLVHRDPETYDEPDAFRPERFLARGYGPEQFLPFGGGAKRCLGATFAMQELMIIVGGLVARFAIRPGRERAARPRPRLITIEPIGGVPVVLARRPRAATGSAPPAGPAAPAPAPGRCPR
jgi:cytochrome P450